MEIQELRNKNLLNDEEIDSVLGDFYDKPEIFFTDYLGNKLWDKQKEILYSIRDHRRTSVRSGNSAGKTWFIARCALWFLYTFTHSVVIDTAPTHRQVENQFWRQLRLAHKMAPMKLGGKLLKTKLDIDEDWFILGFSTQDGEGGMEAFQGWHSKYILVIVDEASGVSPKIFEAIEGAMAGGSLVRLVYIGNPTRATGDFADSFKDPNFNKIHISAFDIPNVKEKKAVVPGLATWEWVQEMQTKYGEDSDIYRVRVLGEFPKKNSDTLIALELVENAVNAEREHYGVDEVIGLDPARYGDDRAAFVYRKGNKAKVLEVIEKCSLMELAGKAIRYMNEYKNAKLRIDIIGLGAGVYDRLREIPNVSKRVEGVNVGTAPSDKETYLNLRAEAWVMARNWLKDAILEPSEEWYQLASPKYKINSRGQILLESKEDMKKRGVKSPDVGDALVLTLTRPTEGSVPLVVWAD